MLDRKMNFERPKSLTTLTSDALRKEILDGRLAMGEALSEATIAKRLGVSRTPVREAFFQLGIEGLVKTEPQRGTFVFRLNRKEIADICNVRYLLECEALRLIFNKNPERLVEEWQRITEAMTVALQEGDAANYLKLDTKFHETLLDLCDNTYLKQAYLPLSFKVIALRNRLQTLSDHLVKGHSEHLLLTQLAREKDFEKAIETMRSHVLLFEGSYWEYNATQTLPDK